MFWISAALIQLLLALLLILFLYRSKPEQLSVWSAVFDSRLKFWTYFLLRVAVIAVLERSLYLENFQHAFLCLLSLILLGILPLAERKFQIELPPLLEASVFCFIFAAEILGEIANFYQEVPGWATALHTINGFLCAAFGYSPISLLNENEKIPFQVSSGYLAVSAFCFSMCIGVLWEFFEFGMDILFLKDLQKDMILYQFGTVALSPDGSLLQIQEIEKTLIEVHRGRS